MVSLTFTRTRAKQTRTLRDVNLSYLDWGCSFECYIHLLISSYVCFEAILSINYDNGSKVSYQVKSGTQSHTASY